MAWLLYPTAKSLFFVTVAKQGIPIAFRHPSPVTCHPIGLSLPPPACALATSELPLFPAMRILSFPEPTEIVRNNYSYLSNKGLTGDLEPSNITSASFSPFTTSMAWLDAQQPSRFFCNQLVLPARRYAGFPRNPRFEPHGAWLSHLTIKTIARFTGLLFRKPREDSGLWGLGPPGE